MKSLLSLLFCVFISGNIHAQIVDIPDPNFKAILLQASSSNNVAVNSDNHPVVIDTNNNGEIEVTEALNIFKLFINNYNLSNLTGIQAFTNLESLLCYDNDLPILDLSQNVNLKTLWAGNNNLTTLDVSENINLENLHIVNNNITTLNVTQNVNLESLKVSSNNLTSLDVTQNLNLVSLLVASDNSLNALDVTQNVNLTHLTVWGNNLSTLDITQNDNLLSLDYSGSTLTTLDISQNLNLERLHCNNSNLTTLDLTQNLNLIDLNCRNNNLTALDLSQNNNLESISIQNNEIQNLELGQCSNLWFFNCANNLVSDLDLSQLPSLTHFACMDNLLTELDLSNNNELELWSCANNQITNINLKNGGYSFITDPSGAFVSITNNPIEFICADEEEITVFNELTNYQGPISSYCTFIPGGDHNIIYGNITLDTDSNGCDVSDYDVPNLRVRLDDGVSSGSTFSNQTGEYTFFTETGNYQLTPEFENPNFFNASPVNPTIDFTDLDNTITQDFCITANGIHNDVEVVIVPTEPAQPGFDASYQLVYKNKGNQVLSGSIDFSYDDSVLDLVSTSIIPAIETSGNLSWDYTDLNPFESRTIGVVFNVNSPMETPAVNIDDILDFTVTANPTTDDETPNDNTFELNQVVIGSYDPNDITCLEGDIVTPDKIGEYLHYNINFENTGTAAATFVVIKDVIDDTNFDISTLQIMYASDEMQTRVVNNTIEFIFDNINLGPNEKGNVVYKIKINNTLSVGDSVENKAEIFFDFNFPIETNVATTSFQVLSIDEFENANAISVFPNPSNNNVTLKSKSNLKSIKVYDAMSRLVFETMIDDLTYSLNISNYSNGLYFLEIQTEFGKNVKQLIKN
ncbi:T9SS type A sorting domain-containing protein [Winogradskyella sp.]|uniref:DUF7619 domain-containing protein n=1 Tax=Winogradskyella sp. TaxID=1883156 RepID=UPI0025FF1A37|nr:T9SS type A sorting domain-containing protein [Winogradskyella sp.]